VERERAACLFDGTAEIISAGATSTTVIVLFLETDDSFQPE
jgi:hypothetical protein